MRFSTTAVSNFLLGNRNGLINPLWIRSRRSEQFGLTNLTIGTNSLSTHISSSLVFISCIKLITRFWCWSFKPYTYLYTYMLSYLSWSLTVLLKVFSIRNCMNNNKLHKHMSTSSISKSLSKSSFLITH